MTEYATKPPAGENGREDVKETAPRPLETFLREIERLTGMQICIYDLNFFLNDTPKLTVPARLLIHNCRYCHFVKSNSDAFAKCIETENWRTEQAGKLNRPLIHTCHAGVTDIILPVKVGGKQIGAVFVGQVFTRDSGQIRETLLELREKYGFEERALEKAASSVNHVDMAALKRTRPLLAAITDYLEQAEELLALQRERAIWSRGKRAYEAMPEGEVPVEEIPTPTLDRILVQVKDFEPSSIRKAVRLIKESYWENPSCQKISRQTGMSESHFSREFHKATGVTYRQCLLETRLNAAFYLIKRNLYTIEEAAVTVGYENGSSLQRAFKAFTGLTPRQFLRIHPRAFMLEKSEALPSPQRRKAASRRSARKE